MKKLVSVLMMLSAVSFLMAAEKVFQHEEFSSDSVKNITIEATSGDLDVVIGNSSKIVVETYSTKRKVSNAKIKLSGDTLSVDTTGWSFSLNPPDVRIFLPKDFSFKDLTLKLSSGDVDIDGVNCDEMNITLTSGDLDIDDSVISGDVKIKSTSGDIDLDDVDCKNFNVELTSGNVSIELSKMTSQKSLLKATSGNITLTLPKDNDGYSATVNTTSGTFKDDFTGMKANNCKNATSVYKSGGVEFELTAKSGTVKIEKAR